MIQELLTNKLVLGGIVFILLFLALVIQKVIFRALLLIVLLASVLVLMYWL